MAQFTVEILVKDMEIFKKTIEITKELIDKLPENEQEEFIKRIDDILMETEKL